MGSLFPVRKSIVNKHSRRLHELFSPFFTPDLMQRRIALKSLGQELWLDQKIGKNIAMWKKEGYRFRMDMEVPLIYVEVQNLESQSSVRFSVRLVI